ncbi:serine hydrolase domain-containing protein [Kitasatospora sp. NPDC059571]|uniref:serine hydrolase domain-containing protein n=1 Tax=Kitasatospora sp. NPDC059571 TaxID=3346871 RepID=UPI003693D3F8
MATETLSEFVEATAAEFGIPGVAVGILADGQETVACHGVTGIDDPHPVGPETLFQVGSVSKTVTATALMRLVADGRVDLAAPVRRYVPELVLADERAASAITVLNLLNHTAGLDWNLLTDTGTGEDALARFTAELAGLPLIAEPGTRSSYSQAGYNLAGRIIEKVTGQSYERAVSALLLEPLDLSRSTFAPDGATAGHLAEGHNREADGTLSTARQWRPTRANNPGGGLASSVTDQLRWAAFHLGDGRAPGGERLLPAELLGRMRQPTVELRGSTLGDALGICWFLRDVDGVRTAGHGGSGNGQFAELLTVPERDFAVVALSNAGPDGILFNQAVVRWALQTHLGVADRDPQPLPHDETWARQVAGHYEIDAMTLTVATDGTGLTLDVRIRPEIRAASETEIPPDHAPAGLGRLPGREDEYIVTEGGLKGQRGYFTRDEAGTVLGIDLAGRLFTRTGPVAD